MNIIGISKLVVLAMLTGLLTATPLATADDFNPDSPDPAAVADSSDASQVLEIPQQCDPSSVGDPCDSGDSAIPSDGAASSDPSTYSDAAVDPASGSLNDYVNQGFDDETVSGGPAYYPVPEVAPSYAYYSPSPVVVSPTLPTGRGFYQPPGPGTYQSWTRGPGSFQPMMGGASFGPRSFGGGSFRRR